MRATQNLTQLPFLTLEFAVVDETLNYPRKHTRTFIGECYNLKTATLSYKLTLHYTLYQL